MCLQRAVRLRRALSSSVPRKHHEKVKKHCKMSLKRRQGWDSCYLSMNVALTLHHTEVNIWVSPSVMRNLLFKFDTSSQMEWTALWKFLFLSTDYRESLNSSAADIYTEGLRVAKATFNAPSEPAEAVLIEIKMGSKLTLWTPTPQQNCAATSFFTARTWCRKMQHFCCWNSTVAPCNDVWVNI